MCELRKTLDQMGLKGYEQPIALIPCGRLGVLPLHAAWVDEDASSGESIPFVETCELTLQASARVLAHARATVATLPVRGPVIAIGDPQGTGAPPLPWAEAEAQALDLIAHAAGLVGSTIILEEEATLPRVLKELALIRQQQSGAWVQIASHGTADPTDPNQCYLLLTQRETLSLAHLQREHLLLGTRLFNASGCLTALGDIETAPDELGSFAAGMLQAGSPCAVATLWSVSDFATFVLMVRFAQVYLAHPSISPARALRDATSWLRHATRSDLEQMRKAGAKGMRPLALERGEQLIDALRGILWDDQRMSVQEALDMRPFIVPHSHATGVRSCSHPIYWAAPVIYGV